MSRSSGTRASSAWRSALSSALTGPLPSAVATMRSPSWKSLTVASVSTRPSARFSVMTRKLSSAKSGS